MDAKKKAILAVSLVVLWAGLAVWQWQILEEPIRMPLMNVSGHSSIGHQAETKSAGLRVNLDVLASMDLRRQAAFTAPRNIFSLSPSDEILTSDNGSISEGQSGSDSAETMSQGDDASESEQYRYVGFLRVGEGYRKNTDMAMLRREDEVLIFKVGDRIDDQRVLKAITDEHVTIRDIGTRRDQTVPLSEKPSEQSSEEPVGQE